MSQNSPISSGVASGGGIGSRFLFLHIYPSYLSIYIFCANDLDYTTFSRRFANFSNASGICYRHITPTGLNIAGGMRFYRHAAPTGLCFSGIIVFYTDIVSMRLKRRYYKKRKKSVSSVKSDKSAIQTKTRYHTDIGEAPKQNPVWGCGRFLWNNPFFLSRPGAVRKPHLPYRVINNRSFLLTVFIRYSPKSL